jgi:hypothetical protein
MSSKSVKTPLQQLLDVRGIISARLEEKLRERLGEKAPDQRQVSRWRLGQTEPRRKSMVHLLWAVREVAVDPSIQMADIIDLDPNNPANWE